MTFNELVSIVNHHKDSLVTLGTALRQVKGDYQSLIGDGINTWSDFLAQPEIGLSVREATSLIQLSELVSSMVVPISDLNLATARFCANKGIYDAELVEDMKVLSLKDFRERHYDYSKKEDNAPRTYTYMVMSRANETGNLKKVYIPQDDLIRFLSNYEREIQQSN